MQSTARCIAGHAARQQLPSPPKLKITATRILALVAPVASVHTASCLAPSAAPHASPPVVPSPLPLVSPNEDSTAALVKRFIAASRKRAVELLRTGHAAMAAYFQWLRRAVNAAARAGWLAWLAAPVATAWPLAVVMKHYQSDDRLEQWCWASLVKAVERSGPTLVKLAQWAGSREDLFPAELTAKFARLQDSTKPHSWKHTVAQLDREMPGWEGYLEFQQHDRDLPLGSGCIAQVHRATLKRKIPRHRNQHGRSATLSDDRRGRNAAVSAVNGQDHSSSHRSSTSSNESGDGDAVVVKVLHPGVRDQVSADMDLLGASAWAVEQLPLLGLQYLSLRQLVGEFDKVLTEQLDLRWEAQNLNTLREHFAGDDLVEFPEPFAATPSCLVERLLEGKPIRDFLSADANTKLQLSQLGMHTVFTMVFLNNFVHADLHPGNLLVHQDQAGKCRLGILDAGMAVRLQPADHQAMTNILLAFMREEGYKAGELMCAPRSQQKSDSNKSFFSSETATPHHGEVETPEGVKATVAAKKEANVAAFCDAIAEVVDRSHQTPFFEKFGSYVADICGLACTHKVRLNEQLVTMAMAIKVLEGIILSLDPNIELCSAAIPMLLQAQLKHSTGLWLQRRRPTRQSPPASAIDDLSWPFTSSASTAFTGTTTTSGTIGTMPFAAPPSIAAATVAPGGPSVFKR